MVNWDDSSNDLNKNLLIVNNNRQQANETVKYKQRKQN